MAQLEKDLTKGNVWKQLIVTNVAAGISTGGTVMIGQFLGAGERENIKKSISTLFITLAALAVILTGSLTVFIDPLLKALNTPSEAYREAYGYLMVSLLGVVFIFGYNALGAVMRGMGDGNTPLKFISVACVVNIVLDFVFVKGLHMGAGDLKRTKKVTGYGLILCCGISIVIFTFVRVFPHEIFRLFGAEEKVVSVGVLYMDSFSFEYVVMPFIVALNGVFIGTGNGWVSLITDTASAFLVRIPLAVYLGTTAGLGVFGIGCAVPCATFVGALITFLFYLSGCWKKSTIIAKPQKEIT